MYLPEVLQWCYPWRRLADRGIPIVGGNDFPFCSRTQAMQTISYLATRKIQAADMLPDWMDGDQLTVEEGLRAMTVTNAWVAFEDEVKGTISIGKLADLTVLSDNPLTTDAYDVRNITVEMTIMDGIIRYNKIGIIHNAVHDAGLFKMGIDDRGLWGFVRSGTGFQYNGLEYLYQGSILISYDSSTVASANFNQQDYITSTGGSIDFQEPGITADEEALAVYEDAAAFHSDKLRITQQTLMWQDDPFLLLNYTFENISENPLTDIYIGQIMDFDIGHYADNMGGWEENNGLGFAYMYNSVSSGYPYIALAMFDSLGNSVNSGLSFTANAHFNGYSEKPVAETMRSRVIDSDTPYASEYSILLSYGPISFDVKEYKSPFIIAIALGKDIEELKSAVNNAWYRISGQTQAEESQVRLPAKFVVFQNYPNPFNPSTTIKYDLPKRSRVIATIYDILGNHIKTIVNGMQSAGRKSLTWNGKDKQGNNVTSGIYFYQIKAAGFSKTNKMIMIK
jgi:hypothetical protein